MSKERRIPSEEDFARADARASERLRNLDVVRDSVMQKFGPLCHLHCVYVLPEGDFEFRVLVFLDRETDLQQCKSIGLSQDIMDFVYREIERVGRGKKEEVTIAFEFDSDENVNANYEGDYWFRLH